MQPLEETEEIIRRLAEGEGLATICRTPNFPSRQAFLRRVDSDPQLADRYTRARSDGLEALAEQILSIADDGSNDRIEIEDNGRTREVVDHDHINRSRLRVDSRKWLLSKLRPDKYGDAIKVEHSGQIGVAEQVRASREKRTKAE